MEQAPLSIHEHFASLPDQRTGNATRHNLLDIVVIAICAIKCMANHDWLHRGGWCVAGSSGLGRPALRCQGAGRAQDQDGDDILRALLHQQSCRQRSGLAYGDTHPLAD